MTTLLVFLDIVAGVVLTLVALVLSVGLPWGAWLVLQLRTPEGQTALAIERLRGPVPDPGWLALRLLARGVIVATMPAAWLLARWWTS